MNDRIRNDMPKSVPGFLSATITLRDAPKEPQTFYYRDIHAIVDWLFARSDLASSMQYVPVKMFDESDDGTRLFHEMNSADLWNEAHVSTNLHAYKKSFPNNINLVSCTPRLMSLRCFLGRDS